MTWATEVHGLFFWICVCVYFILYIHKSIYKNEWELILISKQRHSCGSRAVRWGGQHPLLTDWAVTASWSPHNTHTDSLWRVLGVTVTTVLSAKQTMCTLYYWKKMTTHDTERNQEREQIQVKHPSTVKIKDGDRQRGAAVTQLTWAGVKFSVGAIKEKQKVSLVMLMRWISYLKNNSAGLTWRARSRRQHKCSSPHLYDPWTHQWRHCGEQLRQ